MAASSSKVDVVPASATAIVRVSPSEINPFAYDATQHSGCCQLLKMLIIGLLLFPLRFVVFLIFFVLLWLVAAIGTFTCCSHSDVAPHPVRRPITRCLMSCCSRMILWALGYWWISVKGAYDPTAPVIVSNHVSFVDPFYFAWTMLPMAVAKAEAFKAPFLGTIARAQQTIPVSRGSAANRHAVAEEIARRTRWGVDQAAGTIAQYGRWPPLLVFPEATCTNTRSVIEFKYGAFAPLMPVQPVALDFRQAHLDVSWVGRCSVPLTIIRMMCQVYNHLEVTYLPVYAPCSSTEDAPSFCGRVQRAIASQLNVPVTTHTFLDSLPKRPAAAAAHTAPDVVPPPLSVVPAPAEVVSPTSALPDAAAAPPQGEEEEEDVTTLVRSCSLVP